jgi:hypothetical protein
MEEVGRCACTAPMRCLDHRCDEERSIGGNVSKPEVPTAAKLVTTVAVGKINR